MTSIAAPTTAPFGPKFQAFDRVEVTYTSGVTVPATVQRSRYDVVFKSWTYLLWYDAIPGTWFIPERRLAMASDHVGKTLEGLW